MNANKIDMVRHDLLAQEHGVLVHATDRFHRVVSTDWVEDSDLFRMVMHPTGVGGEHEGDDPAAAAPHTHGSGAHDASGASPHMPSASGGVGEDENGNVQMGEDQEEEEGVREVCERLAGTELGEEMEVDKLCTMGKVGGGSRLFPFSFSAFCSRFPFSVQYLRQPSTERMRDA